MEKKKIDFEILIGGAFGIIAIIAIIAEMSIGGFSAEAIAGGIKDIAGTIVAVLVLIATWIALHPKKEKHFVFEEQIVKRLEQWQLEHANMILFKEDKMDLYMKTDIANFFEGGQSNAAGRFVKIELAEFVKLTFSMNKSLFVGHGEDENISKMTMERLGNSIFTYAKTLCSNEADISYDKSKNNIVFIVKKHPESEAELDKIIEMLNVMYQAFLVGASTRK